MQFSFSRSRKFSIAIRITLLTPVILVFQNCGKMDTSSEVSGSMTATVAVPQVKLEDLVKSYYVNILGRQPTPAELNTALTQLRSGFTTEGLQAQLAGSAEAFSKIAQLLVQAMGTGGANNTNLAYWTSLLQGGTSLDQIRAALGLPAATTT